MPRQTILLLCFLLPSFISLAQSIDSLQTDKQVLAFIRHVDKNWGKAFIIPPKPLPNATAGRKVLQLIKPAVYEKADFDQNGYTDLLFNGFYDWDKYNKTCHQVSLVVLSFGNDSFELDYLTRNAPNKYLAARVIDIAGRPCIRIMTKEYFYKASQPDSTEKTDTLVYKYGGFLELLYPAEYTIEKLTFTFDPMNSDLNGFGITITPDSAMLYAKDGLILGEPFDAGGSFTTQFDTATRHRIMGLLQDIRFEDLNEQYLHDVSDAPPYNFFITYNGGKTKHIVLRGDAGTYGLAMLTEILYQLKYKQHWKLVN